MTGVVSRWATLTLGVCSRKLWPPGSHTKFSLQRRGSGRAPTLSTSSSEEERRILPAPSVSRVAKLPHRLASRAAPRSVHAVEPESAVLALHRRILRRAVQLIIGVGRAEAHALAVPVHARALALAADPVRVDRDGLDLVDHLHRRRHGSLLGRKRRARSGRYEEVSRGADGKIRRTGRDEGFSGKGAGDPALADAPRSNPRSLGSTAMFTTWTREETRRAGRDGCR